VELRPQSCREENQQCVSPDGKTAEWRNAAIPAYQRRTKRADALIAGAYLSGTNTRRVDAHRRRLTVFIKRYAILNLVGVIITTNYRTDAIYLPQDDRRTYVAWSEIPADSLPKERAAALWHY
jgi:hypothetical protein